MDTLGEGRRGVEKKGGEWINIYNSKNNEKKCELCSSVVINLSNKKSN